MSARTIVLSLALVFATAATAAAENPNQTFSGRIMASPKRFAASANSTGAYIAMIRKLSTTNFYEDKKEHTFTIYFAGFLKTKLDDVEYVLKIYELGKAGQAMLASMDQYTDARGQQTILTKVVLKKEDVGVNKELLVTMESKGKQLAVGRIKILGEGEHFTGKVDFSDDDAKPKKSDD
jgi:hypothetical protein